MRKLPFPPCATVEALGDRVVVPGERVGSVRIGMTYGDVRLLLGTGDCVSCQSLAFVRYREVGLELAVTTPAGQLVTPSSCVTAISVHGDLECSGPVRLGARREEIADALGAPMIVGQRALYAGGASVHFDEHGCAITFTVVSPLAPSLFPRPYLRPWHATS